MMNGNIKTFLAVGMILLLFIFSTPIYGQEKGGAGYFITGAGWVLESGDSSIVYSVGGGGHIITNKWIVGGEGHSSFGPDNAGGYGFFNLGYLALETDLILLYPLLGLGGGSMTREGDPSVSKCALLNPAVCCDFLIPARAGSGILLGVHAGCTFTAYSNTFNWSMPYIRVVTGGYGFGE